MRPASCWSGRPARGAHVIAIPFYEQPGGIRVRLLWDTADPDRFIEIVEYADQGAHDRDQARVADDPRDGGAPAPRGICWPDRHRWRPIEQYCSDASEFSLRRTACERPDDR